jgi:hypothetical protein
MTRILVYSNNALLQKIRSPNRKPYSEFKASPLLYKTHPTFTKQISLRPLIKKLIKKTQKNFFWIIRTVYSRKLGNFESIRFICIVSIFLTIFQNEYKEEVLNYIKAFPDLKSQGWTRIIELYVILNIVLMILLEVNIFYQSLQRSFYILLTVIYFRILLFNQNQNGRIWPLTIILK